MTTNTTLAVSTLQSWHDFWRGDIGEWIIARGLRIVLLLIGAVLAARFVAWVARQVTRQLGAAAALRSPAHDPDDIRAGAEPDVYHAPEIAWPASLQPTVTLSIRDDHPRPCQQAVQVVGAPGAGQHQRQDRQG